MSPRALFLARHTSLTASPSYSGAPLTLAGFAHEVCGSPADEHATELKHGRNSVLLRLTANHVHGCMGAPHGMQPSSCSQSLATFSVTVPRVWAECNPYVSGHSRWRHETNRRSRKRARGGVHHMARCAKSATTSHNATSATTRYQLLRSIHRAAELSVKVAKTAACLWMGKTAEHMGETRCQAISLQ